MKQINRRINPGEWRLYLKPGWKVVNVQLKGFKKHTPLVLHNLARDDFHSRLMKRPNGEITEAVVLRSTPNYWLQESNVLMLWPSPAGHWEMQIDYSEGKAA